MKERPPSLPEQRKGCQMRLIRRLAVAAGSVAASVDGFDERVDFLGRKQAREFILFVSGRTDIEHADSIVSIENRDRVARAYFEPAL